MKIARQASQNHHHNTGTSADAEMNRVGARSAFMKRKYKMKKVTIPTAFGPDTIWIGGHAYYDVPGFGMVECSGPGQRGEAYNMYESGIKVGIMGGDEGAPASPTPPKPSACPEPTGEVIDQTINEIPEKRSTPPDYKPNTTPPEREP